MEYLKIVFSFLSGGLAGAVLKHFIDKHNNKLQYMECHHVEDEVISKLPIVYCEANHTNLYSKKYKIVNTTNKDIPSIKIQFSFETQSTIAKCTSYSKEGTDVPKVKINKKNECNFTVTNFNRNEIVEIHLELGNIMEDKFNVTELDVLGVKVKYIDKRRPQRQNPVKLVDKRVLDTSVN
jgi:hypothetical protein